MTNDPVNEAPFRNLSEVTLGANVRVYSSTNLYGCTIGDGSQVGAFVEIQRGAFIGRNCKISSHTFICEGVTIEDECFIGHGVFFINDKKPKACKLDGSMVRIGDWECIPTLVKKGATVGSGAVILCGVTIGEDALVGAGAVVTKDVRPKEVVVGNPAHFLKHL